ncbi:hypothetical protein BKH31_12690 [Actinomyces oris]|uniref:Uncharacterized protein n=1 Tax=Actinomyces oris TaxID=544580 RepID=A0A1Q8V559_9ACTO|nr:hypothetical protein BKH31_12690 [Actinomyces oris]
MILRSSASGSPAASRIRASICSLARSCSTRTLTAAPCWTRSVVITALSTDPHGTYGVTDTLHSRWSEPTSPIQGERAA